MLKFFYKVFKFKMRKFKVFEKNNNKQLKRSRSFSGYQNQKDFHLNPHNFGQWSYPVIHQPYNTNVHNFTTSLAHVRSNLMFRYRESRFIFTYLLLHSIFIILVNLILIMLQVNLHAKNAAYSSSYFGYWVFDSFDLDI